MGHHFICKQTVSVFSPSQGFREDQMRGVNVQRCWKLNRKIKHYYYKHWVGISVQNIFFTKQLEHPRSLHFSTLEVWGEGCLQDAVKM